MYLSNNNTTCSLEVVIIPTLTAATLTVIKHIINDKGYTLRTSDFTMQIFVCGTSGTIVTLFHFIQYWIHKVKDGIELYNDNN